MISEVLDLGIVYVKNVLHEPQKIIDKIEIIDKHLNDTKKQYNNSMNIWHKWEDNNLFFCWQKFLPVPELLKVKKNIPLFEMQLEISEILYDSLDNALKEYFRYYPLAEFNIKSREDNVSILKYESGHFLPGHSDQGVSSRVLSGVTYLNDSYEGGEICFPNSKISLKPEAGSVIFFPSNFIYIHEVNKIENGKRYVIPHWYHNVLNKKNSTGQV